MQEVIHCLDKHISIVDKGHMACFGEDDHLGSRDLLMHRLRQRGIAFVVIAYVYLGAPRTTRQNRAMAVVSAIFGVAVLRLAGFVSIVAGAHTAVMLSIQYVALALVFILGYIAIDRGMLIEPPAWFTNLVAVMTERIQRRFATS